MPSSFLTDFLQFITAIAMFYIKKNSWETSGLNQQFLKPTLGEEVRIAYNLGEDKAKVQRQEVRREARSL